jgi:two-component system, cell cycle sensor histidine kinase and response regulator CckA
VPTTKAMNDFSSHEASDLALLRFVLEHAPDALLVLDPGGAVLASNAAARRLPPALVGRLVSGAHSADALEVDLFRRQLRAQGAAHVETSLDGRVFAVEGRTHEGRRVLRVRDVTDHRRQDAEVRALRRVESVGHFTASLVHDFNNLLTPIACLSACLEGELPEGSSRQLAREVRGAAEKAAALARQTLMWVRREQPHAELVEPGAVLTELRPLVERVVGSEVRVELSAAPNGGAASLDRDRLEYALLNLAANARDAMPTGGTLTLSAARIALEEGQAGLLGDAHAGSYVAVGVTDTGVGMNREVREQIFRRLFTTKQAGRGTGLGLEAVRRFVEDSGGCIAVRSEQGLGTTVSMYFPAVDLAAPVASVPRESEPGGSETILVVDDDDRVRHGLRAVLQSRGYTVVEAPAGERALAIADMPDARIDLVIVDVVLQGASGVELARRIRDRLPARVLFTSGHTEQRLERCGWTDADGPLLKKAFTPAELLRAVRTLLDEGQAARAAPASHHPAGRGGTD